jgi:hypothetical protein
MRARLVASAILVGAVVGVACQRAETEDTMNEGTVYGEALTLQDTTKISDILTSPDDYLGQRVLVTGTIVEVCSMKGCWLELASDREYETLCVKVEDGVIIFPMTARGLQAVAEGVMEKLELTEAEALEQAQHHAEEQGLEFDPSTVTGPETTYQLRGIGAVIFE